MVYHTVYKTTNLVNGKEYFGVHSTTNPDDGYLGTGTNIKHAIKKYGRDNFNKVIVEICDTRQEALTLEKHIVNADIINDDRYYNVAPGGGGRADYASGEAHYAYGTHRTEDTKRKISETKQGEKNPMFGSTWTDKQRAAKVGVPSKKRMPCVLEGIEYDSFTSAALAYGVGKATISRWVKRQTS